MAVSLCETWDSECLLAQEWATASTSTSTNVTFAASVTGLFHSCWSPIDVPQMVQWGVNMKPVKPLALNNSTGVWSQLCQLTYPNLSASAPFELVLFPQPTNHLDSGSFRLLLNKDEKRSIELHEPTCAALLHIVDIVDFCSTIWITSLWKFLRLCSSCPCPAAWGCCNSCYSAAVCAGGATSSFKQFWGGELFVCD